MSDLPSKSSRLNILYGHWLFANLEPDDLRRLADQGRRQRFAANERIFRKGDPGQAMMAVLAGRVKISASSADGKEIVLNIVDEGGVFGEIALLDGKDRTADATAMGATELLVLDRRDMLPFLRSHPEVGLRLIEVLCQRIRNTSEQLEDSLFMLQSARLAKTLLRLAGEFGRETDAGLRIDMKLSQREIGAMVGMRREALNRRFGKWREQGLVVYENGYVTIPDPERFAEFAEDLIWQGLE
jgi:CRP/FNR family cyclic AMP-dependent transcriptional regulator